MKRLIFFSLFMLWCGVANAQYQGCANVATNRVNAGTDITINNTAGGILTLQVPPAPLSTTGPTGRCNAFIRNDGANPMRCCQNAGPYLCVPTATLGMLANAGDIIKYSGEMTGSVNCFSTAGTTANTGEALP